MYEHAPAFDWSQYLVPLIIGFFIYTFIVRWIFLVGPRLKEAKKQTHLLAMIANKLGVDRQQIKRAISPGDPYWEQGFDYQILEKPVELTEKES